MCVTFSLFYNSLANLTFISYCLATKRTWLQFQLLAQLGEFIYRFVTLVYLSGQPQGMREHSQQVELLCTQNERASLVYSHTSKFPKPIPSLHNVNIAVFQSQRVQRTIPQTSTIIIIFGRRFIALFEQFLSLHLLHWRIIHSYKQRIFLLLVRHKIK